MNPLFIRSAALAFAAAAAAPPSDNFDRPIDTKVVKLPADPANPQAKARRTCFVYRDFVVKEVDRGKKGAEELAIAPNKPGNAACPEKLAGEMVVKSEDWSGYALGAKGPFVFFDADDGLNDGLPFAVYSAKSGKKLFEDSHKGEAFNAVALTDHGLVMRYRRVWLAPCSMMSESCWQKVKAATGLADSLRPDCAQAYRREMARTPKFASDIPKIASVIGYNAEGRYADGKLSVRPLPGPVTCWLED
jgi:hypothetical protein